MSKPKFTPGKWKVDENGLAGYGDNGPNFYIVREGKSRRFENLAVLSLTHKLIDEGPTARYEQAKANAYLMASAPDLYAAIANSDDAHWTTAMRAAMAKARGETS